MTAIVRVQEANNLPNTLLQRVRDLRERLGITTQTTYVRGQKKSEWKRQCKKIITQRTEQRLAGECKETKLMFVRKEMWKEKEYTRKENVEMMVKVMKIRLNMTEQKENYKAKYAGDLEYPLCNNEEAVTKIRQNTF